MGNWSIPKVEPPDDDAIEPAFAWPPRRTGDADASVRMSSETEIVVAADIDQVQPSRIGAQPRKSGKRFASVLGAIPGNGGVRATVRAIEREWLDLAEPPLLDRMQEAGWWPDDPATYCATCGMTFGDEGLEGQVVLSEHDGSESCRHCDGKKPAWDRMIRVGAYEHPIRRWVAEVKFTRWRRLARDLGKVLGAAIAERAEIDKVRDPRVAEALRKPVLIVPVPTTFRRLCIRGIDHSLCIARGVRVTTGGTICRPIARSHRPSQRDVLPSERRANVAKSFFPRGWSIAQIELDGRLIVVIDDVTTTGATVGAACRAVRQAWRRQLEKSRGRMPGRSGTKAPLVWAAVLARTPMHGDDRESGF